jgi:hypothetical protein
VSNLSIGRTTSGQRVVVAVLMLLLGVAAGCSSPRDPRAFDVDDNGVAFSEVLSRTHISLPSCAADDPDLRYAFVPEASGTSYRKLYLELHTDDACLDAVISHNGARVEDVTEGVPSGWPPQPAQHHVMQSIGWSLAPVQPIRTFDFRTSTSFGVTGVVQPDPETGADLVWIFGWFLP